MIFLLAASPTAAQTIALADTAVDSDTEAYVGSSADGASVRLGFPALRRAMPEGVYPVKAEQFQIEGRVLVEYTVDLRGRAKDVEILQAIGGGCEDEVKRLLRAARFVPILDADGQATATRFRSAFDFRLN